MSMKLVSGATGLHYMNVIPVKPMFRDTYLALTKAPPAMSTVTEKKFDRNVLDMEDHAILFWDRIPEWLPMKTSARIILIFCHTLSKEKGFDEKAALEVDNLKRTFFRADFVFYPSQSYAMPMTMDDSIVRHSNCNMFIFDPSMPHPTKVHSSPFSNRRSMHPKKWDVAVYGRMTERREKAVRILEKMYKDRFIYFSGVFGPERRKILSSSYVTLHLRSCDGFGVNPFRYIESGICDTLTVAESLMMDEPSYGSMALRREVHLIPALDHGYDKLEYSIKNACYMAKEMSTREALFNRLVQYDAANFLSFLEGLPLGPKPSETALKSFGVEVQ